MGVDPTIGDHLTPRQRAQVENAQLQSQTRFGEDPKVCKSNNLFAGPSRSGGVSSSSLRVEQLSRRR